LPFAKDPYCQRFVSKKSFNSFEEVGVLVVKGGESAEATNKPKFNDKNLTLVLLIKTFAVLLKILIVGGLLAKR
jgi:hypothetical protein